MDRKGTLFLILFFTTIIFAGQKTDSLWVTRSARIDSMVQIGKVPTASASDTFLVQQGGPTIKRRTASQVFSDIGAGSPYDSAGHAGIADTCKHEKDTIRTAGKADTSLHYDNRYLGLHGKADSSVVSDSSKRQDNRYLLLHSKADSSVISDSSKKYDNRYLGLHGKADSCVKADTALHAPNHGVTVGYLPKSATVTTWGTSIISEISGGINIASTHAVQALDITQNNGNNTAYIKLTGNAGITYFGNDDLGNASFQAGTLNKSIYFYNSAGNAPLATLLSNRFVGFGIAAPLTPLHLFTDLATNETFTIENANLTYQTNYPSIIFKTAYTLKLGKIFAILSGGSTWPETQMNFQVPDVNGALVTGLTLQAGTGAGSPARVIIPGLTAGGIVKAAAVTGLLSAAALTAAEMSALFTTPTTNYLQKYNGTNLANSLIYDDGTNVGIGTAAPNMRLQVEKDSNSGVFSGFQNNSNGVAAYSEWRVGENIVNANANYLTASYLNSGFTASGEALPNMGTIGTTLQAVNGLRIFTNAAAPIKFSPNGAEAMRIVSGGNVGIGTTGPGSLLHVGSPTSTANQYITTDAAAAYETGIGFRSAGTQRSVIYRPANTYDLRINITGAGDVITVKPTSGNVGIGTTAPNGKLEVNTNAAWNTNQVYPFQFINLDPRGDQDWGMLVRAGGNDNADYIFTAQDYDGNNVFTITGAGNVGIGTTSPFGYLEISGDDEDVSLISIYSNAYNPSLVGRRATGTVASPTGVVNGSTLMWVGGCGYNSAGIFSPTTAAIEISAAETFGSGANYGTDIVFHTTAVGGTSRTEKLRIMGNGSINMLSEKQFTFGGYTGDAFYTGITRSTHDLIIRSLSDSMSSITLLAGKCNLCGYDEFTTLLLSSVGMILTTRDQYSNYNAISITESSITVQQLAAGVAGIVHSSAAGLLSSSALTAAECAAAVANGTAGTIAKYTAQNTIGNSAFLTENATGVGIGTTAPNMRLQVENDSNSGVFSGFQNNSNGAAAYSEWRVGENIVNANANYLTASYLNSGFTASGEALPNMGTIGTTLQAVNGLRIFTNAAAPIKFSPNGAEAMRIDSGGKVGIGMTPTYTLDVTGNFRCSTGFGCNGATPQTAYASGGAVVPGAGAYGFDSAVHAAALATLVTNIRLALVANGIMS
jgi:hypothetical protein